MAALAFTHFSEFQNAIRDKSTASLSYYSSLMMWLNSLAWSTYGLIIRGDSNIFVPNVLGFVVATLQLHLFVLYGHSFNISSSIACLDCFPLPCINKARLKGRNEMDSHDI